MGYPVDIVKDHWLAISSLKIMDSKCYVLTRRASVSANIPQEVLQWHSAVTPTFHGRFFTDIVPLDTHIQ